jgi:hypothetical protein
MPRSRESAHDTFENVRSEYQRVNQQITREGASPSLARERARLVRDLQLIRKESKE